MVVFGKDRAFSEGGGDQRSHKKPSLFAFLSGNVYFDLIKKKDGRMQTKNTIAWIVAGLLAAAFLFSGYAKLAGQKDLIESFAKWGFSTAFMYFIGAAEVAGGIGVLLKRTRVLAAIGLGIIMVGAVVTHILNGEGFTGPAVLLALLAALLWLRQGELRRLFGRP